MLLSRSFSPRTVSPHSRFRTFLTSLAHASTSTDIVNQKVALKFLESAGHQTEVVENGALALEAVKKNFYDVCLLFLPDPVRIAVTDRMLATV